MNLLLNIDIWIVRMQPNIEVFKFLNYLRGGMKTNYPNRYELVCETLRHQFNSSCLHMVEIVAQSKGKKRL
jgi:hypothetical protein